MPEKENDANSRRVYRPSLPQTSELFNYNRPVAGNAIQEPVSPEMLVPRLGDFLLEKGVIRQDQLQHALDYQRANAIAGNPKMIGQVLVELGAINRETLDQVVTEQIIALHTALKDTNQKLELHVQQRTGALEWRLIQIRTAAEVAQQAISATRLEDLLRITTRLIVERFGYYHAAIYLLDETQHYAVLREATGAVGQELKNRGYRISIGSQSILGWVTEHRQTRVVSNVKSDSLFLQDELLPETRSEASIPLMLEHELLGVLDVQSKDAEAFNKDDIAVLQTLASQIASSIKTLRTLELTELNLQEVRLMYAASSKIAKVHTSQEILQIAATTLAQTPHITAVMQANHKGIQVFTLSDPDEPTHTRQFHNRMIEISPQEILDCFGSDQSVIPGESLRSRQSTAKLMNIVDALGCQDSMFLPIRTPTGLAGVWMLASHKPNFFSPGILQPYLSLAEFVSTTLAKIQASEKTEQQVTRLKILNQISQIIATETELTSLYQSVHKSVSELLQSNSFYIALYDSETNSISFPYLFEDGERLQLDPIPLGEGLTSIVIRTKSPLLLVGDTENQARALGAKTVGKLAKSWLGVPLLIGESILGVITIQDTEKEYAFSEEDAQLLMTLAAQVSVAIRNARLISSVRRQAERQQVLFEITEKIRRSVDMENILAITTQELTHVLGARRAHIQIRMGESHHDIHPSNGKGQQG
jgi:GAF domain-containing protein